MSKAPWRARARGPRPPFAANEKSREIFASGSSDPPDPPDPSNPPDYSLPLTTALIVPKEKIAANGDYNLSGERYREAGAKSHRFPLAKIGDVCAINPSKSKLATLKSDTRVSFVPMADLNENQLAFPPCNEKLLSEVSTSDTYFEDNNVLLAKVTPYFENGKAAIARGLLNGIGFGSSEFYVLRSSPQVLPEWIYFCVMHPLFRDAAVAQMTGTGGLQRVPRGYVENFQIPLPRLEVQKEIVAEIEAEQALVAANRELITRFEQKIQATFARIWGEETPAIPEA